MSDVKIKENYRKALEMYYESAEKGNAQSQLQLGKMFFHGEGVERDLQAALEWIRKSAAQGNGEAQAYLGQMHEKCLGVERDLQQALELYKKAAEQGNARGQAGLAGLYLAGAGVEQNLRTALVWYQKSAAQGNVEAQAQLGHMVEKGLGVNRDIHKAAALFKKAAEQDNAFAQLRLGDFYLNGLAVEQNPRKAFAWYKKAAEQDEDPESAAQAQLKLAAMYCQGNGVEKDLNKGFEFYERSARLDNAEAQFCLGAMYEDGVGVERDHAKALEWFQRSSQKSKTPSNSAMGDIYRDGLVVEKNIPEAMMWYKKAADEGDAYAKTELLKLQNEEGAQKKAKTDPAPLNNEAARAAAAAADTRPGTTGAEKIKEKVRAEREKTVEQADLPARGQLKETRPPKSSRLKSEKTVPEKKSPAPAPIKIKPAPKAHAPRKSLYLFSALGIVALAVAGAFFGLRNKPAGTMENLELGAKEITALPRPDPGEIPTVILLPPGEILKKINAGKAVKKSAAPLPVVEAKPAPAAVAPAAPLLRREYKTLDEGAVFKMLAAKNMFDAARNPAGNFRHGYEIRNAAGLRLIVDRATNLVWSRQQSAVRMNLKKSLEWIASLNKIEFGEIKNWRLPTLEEAASLLKKNGGKTFLDTVFGEGIHAIWTGDGFSGSESWVVDFQNGTADHAKNKSKLMILMVSSGRD